MIFLMLQVVICALVLGDLVLNNEKLKTVNMLAHDLLGLFKNLEDVQNPVPALISTLVLADAIFMLSLIVMFKRVSACKLMGLGFLMLFLSSCITVIVFYDEPIKALVKLLVDVDDLTAPINTNDPTVTKKGDVLCKSISEYKSENDDFSQETFTKCLGETGTDKMCIRSDADVYTLNDLSGNGELKVFEGIVDECLAEMLGKAKMFSIEEQIAFAACMLLSFAVFTVLFVHMIVLQNSETLSLGLN